MHGPSNTFQPRESKIISARTLAEEPSRTALHHLRALEYTFLDPPSPGAIFSHRTVWTALQIKMSEGYGKILPTHRHRAALGIKANMNLSVLERSHRRSPYQSRTLSANLPNIPSGANPPLQTTNRNGAGSAHRTNPLSNPTRDAPHQPR